MKKEILLAITILSLSLLIISFLVISAANEKNFDLLTKPYLKFDAETEITAPLNVKGTINLISENGIKGKIKAGNLTEERNYILPNLSGEICLSAGNCIISPRGSQNRLAKFGLSGLDNSSIEDLAKEVSIFIDENGNIGIGQTPDFKLHVAGKIQARDDICTDLKNGICLSQVEKITSLAGVAVEGEGTAERVPLWKKNYQLGDSVIFQENENIGIGLVPGYKLDVAGTVRMLGFRLPVTPKKGYGLLSDDKGFGTWQPVLTPLSGGGDVAENFLLDPKCKKLNNCPESGDLVSINEEKFIEKSQISYDKKLIGVISTNPTLTMEGQIETEKSKPVALIGKVPTKVSLLNGEIEIGDAITSSSLPGIGQKATQYGKIVGFALESLSEKDFENCQKNPKVLDCEKKIGKIEVLINLQIFSDK